MTICLHCGNEELAGHLKDGLCRLYGASTSALDRARLICADPTWLERERNFKGLQSLKDMGKEESGQILKQTLEEMGKRL